MRKKILHFGQSLLIRSTGKQAITEYKSSLEKTINKKIYVKELVIKNTTGKSQKLTENF
jgi:hypothetical protein